MSKSCPKLYNIFNHPRPQKTLPIFFLGTLLKVLVPGLPCCFCFQGRLLCFARCLSLHSIVTLCLNVVVFELEALLLLAIWFLP